MNVGCMSLRLDKRFEDLVQQLAERFAALEAGSLFPRIVPGLFRVRQNFLGHACLSK